MYSEKISNQQQETSNESLMIDAPGSAHEKEADDAAMKVIHGDQLMGGGGSNDETVSMSGVSKEEKGMVAPPMVKSRLENAKGRGAALPDHVKRQMKGSGNNPDAIRIHTDSNAAQLSKAMNANAFTYGKDIFFGQGKFDTYTSAGKELLAHELQHTRQESGREKIQRKPVDSRWGTFTDFYYEPIYFSGKGCGVEMYMKFKPGPNVNASAIGMVQSAMSYNLGEPEPLSGDHSEDAVMKSRSIDGFMDNYNPRLGVQEEGFQIDQQGHIHNPLYAAEEPRKGDTMLTTPTKPVKEDPDLADKTKYKGWGQHGHHILDNEGKPEEKPLDAELSDRPQNNFRRNNSGQIFETTALAIDGVQKGTYYGSVTWGWQVDGNGEYKKLDMQLVSDGMPSATFLKAAELWNKGQSTAGEKNFPLPIPDFNIFVIGSTEARFYQDPGKMDMSVPMLEGVRVKQVGEGMEKDGKQYTRIEILEGTLAEVQGWVESGMIVDEQQYMFDNTPQQKGPLSE
jgi:hypothetical protein